MIGYHPDVVLQGVFTLEPQVYRDARGYFAEVYHADEFAQVVSSRPWVQENESHSTRGVLRGLHLQRGACAQAKLVRCVRGAIMDVIVDLRPHSETYGRWQAYELSEENHMQLYVPRHFAHGFLVLSDEAVFLYKVDNVYAPRAECCIRYDDPSLGIPWSSWGVDADALTLSSKDLQGVSLADYTASLSSESGHS